MRISASGLILGLLGGFLLAGHCTRAGETVRVDGAVVPIADGWKRADKDDTVVLTPRDLPAGMTCSFTLLGGVPFDGLVKDQMAAEWKAYEALGTMAGDSGTTIDGEGGPVEVAARAGRIDNTGKNSAYILIFVVKANQRVERMAFVAGSPEAMQKYAGEVAGMMTRATYRAPKPPEPLRGVCFGLAQVKTHLEPECWIFLPDGVVFQGFPYGGPAELDLAVQVRHRRGAVGTYKSDGEDVLVTMKKEKEPMRFTASKGAWAAAVTWKFQDRRSGVKGNTVATWTEEVPTLLRIARADPCDGLKLSGTYRADLRVKDKTPTIRFTADGGFTEEGLIHDVDTGIVDADGRPMPSVAPDKGGSGKYAIAKNTLVLNYPGGAKVSLTFMVSQDEPGKKAPGEFYVHQTKLVLIP